jgi:hypothetical protein
MEKVIMADIKAIENEGKLVGGVVQLAIMTFMPLTRKQKLAAIGGFVLGGIAVSYILYTFHPKLS